MFKSKFIIIFIIIVFLLISYSINSMIFTVDDDILHNINDMELINIIKSNISLKLLNKAISNFEIIEGRQIENFDDIRKYYPKFELESFVINKLFINQGMVFIKHENPKVMFRVDNHQGLFKRVNAKTNNLFTIVDAAIEVNPLELKDDKLKRDVLHLYFSQKVELNTDIVFNINNLSANSEEKPDLEIITGKKMDEIAKTKIFRWYSNENNKYIDGEKLFVSTSNCIFFPGLENDKSTFWNGNIPDLSNKDCKYPETYRLDCNSGPDSPGGIFETSERMEIVIVLPSGTSGSLIPGKHYINLTGNNLLRNKLFLSKDGKKQAIMSRFPVKIRLYD